jgi:hypothetical protein
MGQRGQASGPRTRLRVPPRVRCGPTSQPHYLDPSSPPRVLATLRRRFGLVPRVVSLELIPLLAVRAGLQCRRLDDRAGQRAASGQRHASYAFIKGTPSHAGHTHQPPLRLHTLRAHHERPLALQPEDRARRRGVWVSLAGTGPGTGPLPDALAASAPPFASARIAATGGSAPCPVRSEAAASTAAPARPRLRASQAG